MSNRNGYFDGRFVSDDPDDAELVSGLNEMVAAVNQNRLGGGPGTYVRRSVRGTMIQAKASPLAQPLIPSWNWKVKNTTTGTTGQVQINGGDGFLAALNGRVANVSGQPSDTQFGSPPAYPQLSISGNGVVYGYAVPATPGSAASLAPGSGTLDVYYSGTLPSIDTANPATYFPFLLATITGYTVGTGGAPIFKVNNATNYGWTTLIYCGGAIQVY